MAMMKIGRAEIERIKTRAESLRARAQNLRKQAEKTTEKVVRTAEVGAAAFVSGLVQGKTGGVELLGMPLELWLGGGLSLAGYVGLAGKQSDHLNSLGDGFLAAFLVTLGRGVGETWEEKSKDEPKQVASSDKKAISKGSTLSDAEIAAVARQVAAQQT